jgi:hypothetical protein
MGIRPRPTAARIEFESNNLSRLLGNFGIEVTGLGKLSAHSDLEIGPNEIRLRDFDGLLDEHQFSFNVNAGGFDSRPRFELDGQLNQLDLKKFSSDPEDGDEAHPSGADFGPLFEVLGKFDGKIDLKIGQLPNTALSVEEIALKARADQGFFTLERANLFLAGSPLEAAGELDLSQPCPRLETRLLVLDADLHALSQLLNPDSGIGGRAGQTLFEWSSCGRTAREHLGSMHLQSDIRQLGVTNDGAALPVVFSSIQASAAWNDPGRLKFNGTLFEEPVVVEIGYGSLDEVLSGADWALRVLARGSDSRLDLDGLASIGNNGLTLGVDVDLEVMKFGSLRWIGANPESQEPLSVHAGLELKQAGLALEKLEARLGNSDVSGRIYWAGPDNPDPMIIDLASNRIDLSELVRLFPKSAETPPLEGNDLSKTSPEIDWIDKWLRFPPAEIDLDVAKVSGINYEVSNLNLQVQLRDRHVDGGRLRMKLAEIEIDGALDMDFRQSPGNMRFDFQLDKVDVGGLLTDLQLADGLELWADHVEVASVTEGDSLLELVSNQQFRATIDSLRWNFKAGPEETANTLRLDDFEMIASPGSLTTWRASGDLNGLPLKAFMKSPSIGATFDRRQDLPLTLVIGAGTDVTMLEGVTDRRTPGVLQADLSVSGESLDVQNVEFSELESPLGDYELASQVTIREKQLLLDALRLSVGESRISGTVDMRYTDPKYLLDIELKSPFLETDDFVRWAEDYRNAEKITNMVEKSEKIEDSPDAGIIALISRQFVEFTENFDFGIHIDVDELRSAAWLLGQSTLIARSNNEELKVRLDITHDGRNIEADYHGKRHAIGVDYGLDIHVEGLEYGGLLRLLDPDSQGNGQLFLDASLVSKAPDPSRLVHHLEGNFDLAAFPQDAEADFLDLWASNLIFALLPASEDSGKRMNCMVARFDVENGVMKSNDTFLDSTDIIVRARGDIDLARRELELLVAPQAKVEKFLSVKTPIMVSGPFNDFSVGVAPGGFVTTMMRWYYGLIYVPWKWLTGERFPADGIATCHNAMGWPPPEG